MRGRVGELGEMPEGSNIARLHRSASRSESRARTTWARTWRPSTSTRPRSIAPPLSYLPFRAAFTITNQGSLFLPLSPLLIPFKAQIVCQKHCEVKSNTYAYFSGLEMMLKENIASGGKKYNDHYKKLNLTTHETYHVYTRCISGVRREGGGVQPPPPKLEKLL